MERITLGDATAYLIPLVRGGVPIPGLDTKVIEVRFRHESGGAAFTKVCPLEGDAADAVIRLTLDTDDFNQAGKWYGEVVITMGGGAAPEHAEEPFELYVRPEYERGPR